MEGSPAIASSFSSSSSSSETPPDVLPRYLKVLCPLGVILCVEHGGCYTGTNVARHLARSHFIKAGRAREILDFIKSTSPIASCPSDVPKPAHGRSPISGLPIHDGYRCDAIDCNFLTVNVDSIKQHCFKLHDWKRKLDKSIPYQAAKLQTLWVKTQHVDYFIVIPPANQSSSGSGGSSSSGVNRAVGNSKMALLSVAEAESAWNALRIRFQEAQDKRAERYSRMQVPAYISKITP